MPRRPSRWAPVALAAALTLGAASPALAQSPPPSAAIDAYVERAYADLLGREPSGFERTRWTEALAGGTPRTTFARALVQSEEFEADLIGVTFLVVLGRHADAAGTAFFAERLGAGATTRYLETSLLAAPEFETTNGGVEGAVRALFDIALQRPASEADVAYFAAATKAARTRGIVGSPEATRLDVRTAFASFLGRPPDAGGSEHWSTTLRRTGDEQALWAALGASPEYAAAAAPAPSPTTRHAPGGDPLGTVLAARLATH